MSNYYCQECERPRNRKLDGYEVWNGEPVCEDCFDDLNECDHAWKFKQDTEGDGRDCSYYECSMQLCDRWFYANDIPDDVQRDLI